MKLLWGRKLEPWAHKQEDSPISAPRPQPNRLYVFHLDGPFTSGIHSENGKINTKMEKTHNLCFYFRRQCLPFLISPKYTFTLEHAHRQHCLQFRFLKQMVLAYSAYVTSFQITELKSILQCLSVPMLSQWKGNKNKRRNSSEFRIIILLKSLENTNETTPKHSNMNYVPNVQDVFLVNISIIAFITDWFTLGIIWIEKANIFAISKYADIFYSFLC